MNDEGLIQKFGTPDQQRKFCPSPRTIQIVVDDFSSSILVVIKKKTSNIYHPWAIARCSPYEHKPVYIKNTSLIFVFLIYSIK